MKVGILHPGAMGSALGGHISGQVIWASEGRSVASRDRALRHRIEDLGTLGAVAVSADVIISVCPPAAARAVAEQVAAHAFAGIYLDANAISPRTAEEISRMFPRFVDGGIVGPPPTEPNLTRLYLSGEEAGAIEPLFEGSLVEVDIIGEEPGRASALKMAYGGWTKGSSALLYAIAGMAQSEGVLDHLIAEWEISIPDLPERLTRGAGRVGDKAWRFTAEMGFVAETLGANFLPTGFHEAAEEVYRRLSDLKDRSADVGVPQMLDQLLGQNGGQE